MRDAETETPMLNHAKGDTPVLDAQPVDEPHPTFPQQQQNFYTGQQTFNPGLAQQQHQQQNFYGAQQNHQQPFYGGQQGFSGGQQGYYGYGGGGQPFVASPPKPDQRKTLMFACFWVCCGCVLIAVIVSTLVALLVGDCEVVELGKEIREGNNYVSLVFTACPSEEAFEAFQNAASRWSNSIAESRITPPRELTNERFNSDEACGFLQNSVTFEVAGQLDHLVIFAETIDIDGPGQVLAAAAPCVGDEEVVFPVVGGMQFDNADLQVLENSGTLEFVILHEMGHVLGIGTLWNFKQGGGFAYEADPLLEDPVFEFENGEISDVNRNNIPKYKGLNGIAEFKALTGEEYEGFVPVEDGRDANGDRFFNIDRGEGAGSIDGHWKFTTFGNELLTFQIDADDARHPLSAMTINSLSDLGYNVTFDEADDYNLPRDSDALGLKGVSTRTTNLRGDSANPRIFSLANDIAARFDHEKHPMESFSHFISRIKTQPSK